MDANVWSTGAETERLSRGDKGALAKMRADSPTVALPAKAGIATGASKKADQPRFLVPSCARQDAQVILRVFWLSCACSGGNSPLTRSRL